MAKDDSKDPAWLKELLQFLKEGPGLTRGDVTGNSGKPLSGDPKLPIGKIEGDDWDRAVKALSEMERMMGFPSRDVSFAVWNIVA